MEIDVILSFNVKDIKGTRSKRVMVQRDKQDIEDRILYARDI